MSHVTRAVAGWRPGRRTWLLSGLVVTLTALLTIIGLTSMAWGDSLRDEGRLLPGTTISSVDVGNATTDEAVEAVGAHLDPRLDRVVEVTHEDRTWETTARELGASTDVEEVVAEAFERTTEAGLTDLARMRWTGASVGPQLAASLGVPDDGIEGFVAAIAEDVDREPTEAVVRWTGEAFEIEDSRDGREVDVAATADALADALDDGPEAIELPIEAPAPEVTTADAEAAVDELAPAVHSALDHQVTVAHGDSTWSTTPRELGATPAYEQALETVLADGGADEVSLEVPNDAVSGLVASIAGELDVSPRNAEFDVAGSGFDITPERDGQAVDRDAAGAELREALAGGADRVDLQVQPVRASVTRASFDTVLLLRQDERRLYLVRDGQAVRDWPVAVGMGGSPTPMGTFTVGAMREAPVWNNPSPDGWGEDMPARIGPGPDNPLGVRAINWNDNGRDTLIRFHGTPNEDSIGEAASQGCVRMYNDDVVELFGLVSTGTMIVSTS